MSTAALDEDTPEAAGGVRRGVDWDEAAGSRARILNRGFRLLKLGTLEELLLLRDVDCALPGSARIVLAPLLDEVTRSELRPELDCIPTGFGGLSIALGTEPKSWQVAETFLHLPLALFFLHANLRVATDLLGVFFRPPRGR